MDIFLSILNAVFTYYGWTGVLLVLVLAWIFWINRKKLFRPEYACNCCKELRGKIEIMEKTLIKKNDDADNHNLRISLLETNQDNLKESLLDLKNWIHEISDDVKILLQRG